MSKANAGISPGVLCVRLCGVERVTRRVAALDCVCIEELPWLVGVCVCVCVFALAIVVQCLIVFSSCF